MLTTTHQKIIKIILYIAFAIALASTIIYIIQFDWSVCSWGDWYIPSGGGLGKFINCPGY